jgi:hypothetical protein
MVRGYLLPILKRNHHRSERQYERDCRDSLRALMSSRADLNGKRDRSVARNAVLDPVAQGRRQPLCTLWPRPSEAARAGSARLQPGQRLRLAHGCGERVDKRLCLSEIKLACTDDEGRQEMA